MFDVLLHQLFLGYVAIGIVAIGIAFVLAEASILVPLAIGLVLAPGLCAYFFGDAKQEQWVVLAGLVETPFILLGLWFFFWADYQRLLTYGFVLAFVWIMAVYPITQLIGVPSPELMSFNQMMAVALGVCVVWGLSLFLTRPLWKHELQTAEPYRGEAAGAAQSESVA